MNQVILVGKRESRRHSTTTTTSSVLARIVVAKTSYQMLEFLSFWDRESALTLSIKIQLMKKSTMKLSGMSTF